MESTKKAGNFENVFLFIFEAIKKEKSTFEAIARMNSPYGTFKG